MKKDYRERMVVQEWMCTALIELMKEHDYDSITITQITEKAGVSRMTYYRNYVSKEDILRSYGNYLTELFANEVRIASAYTAEKYFSLLFSFIEKNIDYIKTLIDNRKSGIILDAMNRNIEDIASGKNLYTARFAVGAFYNLMLGWINGGQKESCEEIAHIMFSLINPKVTENINNLYSEHFNKL